MAVRTSPTLVRTVISLPESFVIDPFILPANELVTEKCTASGYSDDRLELIERWLAAHFCAVYKRRTQQEQASGQGASVMAQYDPAKIDFFLYETIYGSQAMTLDTKGNLAGMVNAMKEVVIPLTDDAVKVTWLGTDWGTGY